MIYFLRQGMLGNVKIGKANDIAKRVKQLQTGQPSELKIMRLLEGDLPEERALHDRFKVFSVGGEWFTFHESMLGEIGFPDVTLDPLPGNLRAHVWPSGPCEYQYCLHREITDRVGGIDEIGRRVGLEPWKVWATGRVNEDLFGALCIMARERGIPNINMRLLIEVKRNADDHNKSLDYAISYKARVNIESEWIKMHPGTLPWWTICEENKSLISISGPVLVSSREGVAA